MTYFPGFLFQNTRHIFRSKTLQRKWNCLVSVFLLNVVFMLPGCASIITYTAEPIEARIVDAKTKQPIEGAVIVAHWALEESTIVSITVRPAGELMVMEAVSDSNGRFYFPGWGPVRHWSRSRLTFRDPGIIVFKSGYQFRVLANPMTPEAIGGKADPVRRSQWNGKVIELELFDGTREKYAKDLWNLNSQLAHIATDNPKECNWKKIPNAVRAMNRESKLLEAEGIDTNGIASIDRKLFISNEYLVKKGGCGSPEEFFKDLLP